MHNMATIIANKSIQQQGEYNKNYKQYNAQFEDKRIQYNLD